MDKFDYLMEHKGAFFSFIFFLIPGMPKDYFCYLLGLSPMHVMTFLVISTVGRIPGTLVLTLQGQAVRSEEYRVFFVVLGLALVGLVITLIYRDQIEKWLHKKHPPQKKPDGGKPKGPLNSHPINPNLLFFFFLVGRFSGPVSSVRRFEPQAMFHRGLDLRQEPGVHAQVVDGGVILKKADAWTSRATGSPEARMTPGWTASPMAGPPLTNETLPSITIRSGFTGMLISAARCETNWLLSA